MTLGQAGVQRKVEEAILPDSTTRNSNFAPRSFVNSYAFEPWYFPTPPSTRHRSVFPSYDPDPPSTKFRPDGYRLEEIGPVGFERMGHDAVMQEAERIQGGRVEGPYAVEGVEGVKCPMGFGSS